MNSRLDAVVLRRARQEDARALAVVHTRCWQAAYRELLPAEFLAGLSISDWTERWHTRLHDQPQGTTVAELGGELVGFASVGPSRDEDLAPTRWIELNRMYLLPSGWGTGLAGRLLLTAVRSDRSSFLWVFQANLRAQGFYRKAGYQPDGTSKPITIETTTLTEIRYRRP
jgi:GNAT superfamily N-acetyltransferase